MFLGWDRLFTHSNPDQLFTDELDLKELMLNQGRSCCTLEKRVFFLTNNKLQLNDQLNTKPFCYLEKSRENTMTSLLPKNPLAVIQKKTHKQSSQRLYLKKAWQTDYIVTWHFLIVDLSCKRWWCKRTKWLFLWFCPMHSDTSHGV